jgi:transposase InsO family protein
VRRYHEVVRHLLQTLSLAGFPGDRSIALALARVGWKLSRRTVQRVRKEKEPIPSPPPSPGGSPRAVRARFPNHVWMLDLTELPGLFRLFSFKLAVIYDVFSRAPLAARVFLLEPSGRDIARLLDRTARRTGPPRHSVSDHGPQFTSRVFRRSLARLGIRHRYGAIGKAGSIAILERFFRTLKATASLRSRPPLLRADLERRLAQAFAYYLWLRPHQALGGGTPAEVYLDLDPPCPEAIPPPRGWPGDTVTTVAPFEIHHLDPEGRLPFLIPKGA